MRYLLLVLSLLILPASPARADLDVSVRIGIPGVRIGIDVPSRPRLARIPGHPVYYDPAIRLNLFFYDDRYWVFQDGEWFVSRWHNGPWDWVDPYYVPIYVLVIPVRYYRVPPPFFRGWYADEPPRWGHHWGHEWQDHRKDWDRRHDHGRRDDRGDWDRKHDRDDWGRKGDDRKNGRDDWGRKSDRDGRDSGYRVEERHERQPSPVHDSSPSRQKQNSRDWDEQRGRSYEPQRHEQREMPQRQPEQRERGESRGKGHGNSNEERGQGRW